MPALAPDVVIVTHNTDYYLLNLLRSLEPHRAAGAGIHVWDNASSDRTSALLEAYADGRPWLHVRRSDVNIQHGPALDALISHACRSEWALVLDADTEVTRPFGAALEALDLRDAVFVGQVHPQMPHLYAYLAHLLVHRARYLELPPFKNDGAPGVDYFRAAEEERRPYVRFRWCDYVHHFGQGALGRLVERGDTDHQLYDFAAAEQARHPKSPERLRREQELRDDLDAFLAKNAARPQAVRPPPAVHPPVVGPVAAPARAAGRPNGSRHRLVDELGLWARAPRLARHIRAARRVGLVQRDREAAELARLVAELRPERVIEIGTAHGGSFLLWARAAAADATLVSIDLPPWELDDPAEADKQRALARMGSRRQAVHVIRGSSHDPAVRARARDCLGRRPLDFLFIDGDRSYDGVMSDFRDYAGWVRPGGVIALHDIHPHSRGWGGDVPAVWRVIRDRYRHTELIADPRQDGFGIGVIRVRG